MLSLAVGIWKVPTRNEHVNDLFKGSAKCQFVHLDQAA